MDKSSLYFEGNNGGNYLRIRPIDDRLIELEIGDCCVHITHEIISVEALTSMLTSLLLDARCASLGELAKSHMRWQEDINQRLAQGNKVVSGWMQI